MKAEPIIRECTVNAPAAQVWKALTDSAQMKQWYFDIPGFKPETGFEFEFNGGTEENTYLHKCVVTAAIPNRKLSHSWRYDGYEGNSMVTWELFENNGQTLIRLTHEGLETFPPMPDFARSNFEAGWNYIVGTSIASYLKKQSYNED